MIWICYNSFVGRYQSELHLYTLINLYLPRSKIGQGQRDEANEINVLSFYLLIEGFFAVFIIPSSKQGGKDEIDH